VKSIVFILIMLCISVNLSSQTVYITKSGMKYHTSGCRYLSQSKIAIDLSDAVNQGYSPCSVCGPPTKSKANSGENKAEALQSKDATIEKTGIKQNTVSAQTVYITKTGAKYHKSGCTYLKYSSIPVSLEDATKRGYTPCSVCKPPK
jgi:hypothetical protein